MWGSDTQQVRVRASLRVRCLESSDAHSLKYMAEIVTLTSSFGGVPLNGRLRADARAEPVFEEVGEAIAETATRVKRNVSTWFTKTWSSVKDFFVGIFAASERSSVDGDRAMAEAGVDAPSHCKAAGKTTGQSTPLPIDESVFDELEPKYYIGASSSEDATRGTKYELAGEELASKSRGDARAKSATQDDLSDASLCFFDDPQPVRRRNKRADDDTASSIDARERALRLPFVFVQSRSGKIVEVRFGAQELDTSVRNFKRHLCDLFATNLAAEKSGSSTMPASDDTTSSRVNEITPVGALTASYLVDASDNSSAIRRQLNKANGGDDERELLVHALAATASSGAPEPISGEPRTPQQQQQVSVLRSINASRPLDLSAPMQLAQQIERMDVRVRQVQHIADGRMTGTAGSLSMSLSLGALVGQAQNRWRRAAPTHDDDEAAAGGGSLDDMAQMMHVRSSFKMQLATSSVSDSTDPVEGEPRRKARAAPLGNDNVTRTNSTARRRVKSSGVLRAPTNVNERARTLDAWRAQEAKLRLGAPSSLVAERDSTRAATNDWMVDAQSARLGVLRDQIHMRINEELMRNRARRSPAEPTKSSPPAGLALTQLVLDTGHTSRAKGSMYSALEEALQLEDALGEHTRRDSIARLLRDTARMDRVRAHCRAALAKPEELWLDSGARADHSRRLQLRAPFGLDTDDLSSLMIEPLPSAAHAKSHARRAKNGAHAQRRHAQLNQCLRLAGLLLRAEAPESASTQHRQAGELLVELVDECNKRLVQATKHEELGHGPTSRYYRGVRQQLVELLADAPRPSDKLIEALVARLSAHYASPADALLAASSSSSARAEEPEFVYVPKDVASSFAHYNKSLLREEDDANNSDGAGPLLSSLAALIERPSVSRSRRSQAIDTLLALVRSVQHDAAPAASSCAAWTGSDVDALEALASVRASSRVAERVLRAARKCAKHEHYVLACVRALQGQVRANNVQRYLIEQMRARDVACSVKQEIAAVLHDALVASELERLAASGHEHVDVTWPAAGFNQLDEAVREAAQRDKHCASLAPIVASYIASKRAQAPIGAPPTRRDKRAAAVAAPGVANFWDKAQCKRWLVPPAVGEHSQADPLADDYIVDAFNTTQQQHSSDLLHARAERLVAWNSSLLAARDDAPFALKRHRCEASKTFGPQGAQAHIQAELVNELAGDAGKTTPQPAGNRFAVRFRLAASLLGNKLDVGRMHLWHARKTTRARVNIMGKSLWDTSHTCKDRAPKHLVYMPLFDFNLWLLKLSFGLRLHAEMGFDSNCPPADTQYEYTDSEREARQLQASSSSSNATSLDELELYPRMRLRASAEGTARFVAARAGVSLASQYAYTGAIRVGRQPDACMSMESAHEPMNVTVSSWYQLWDGECHFWGSRNKAEPQATKWRLSARRPSKWLADECLA